MLAIYVVRSSSSMNSPTSSMPLSSTMIPASIDGRAAKAVPIDVSRVSIAPRTFNAMNAFATISIAFATSSDVMPSIHSSTLVRKSVNA